MPRAISTPTRAFARYRALRIERGLYLVEPKNGKTYVARCRIEGQWRYENLNTSDYQQATQTALKWFRSLNSGERGAGETMAKAVTTYLDSIRDDGKRRNHHWRWQSMREFWAPGMGRDPVFVADIDSPMLVAFVEWKREQVPGITASTLKKDLVTVRQVLRYAVLRGTVKTLPEFPGAHVVGRVQANPQPWLTKPEWTRLLKLAGQRVKDAPNIRTRRQREELLHFMTFMHGSCLRVDEARHIRVRDCVLKSTWGRGTKARGPKGQSTIQPEMKYLEINVRTSKTGPRTCVSRPEAAYTFEEIVAAGKKPGDQLFAERHRDAFRELLNAADLRVNAFGLARNAKCLRPTGMSHWLIDQPTIPLSWLAANCGTSITMLQQFYVRRLGLTLDGLAWL